MAKNILVIIDPQNDFVDPKGALYVSGAEKTIRRIAKFIDTRQIDRILVSQDSHQYYNIGFTDFWDIPRIKPFDKIGVQDIVDQKVKPHYIDPRCSDAFYNQFKHYRHQDLTIWPYHCIEGSWGQCFPDPLIESLNSWSSRNNKTYTIYKKGNIPVLEAYSLFPSVDYVGPTYIPKPEIYYADTIYVCGFCKDICVAETLYSMRKQDVLYRDHIVILDNCMATLDQNSPNLEIYDNLVNTFGAKIENV